MSRQRLITFMLTTFGTLLFIVAQMGLASTSADIDALNAQTTSIVDIAGYERTLMQRMLALALLMQRYEHADKALIAPHAELIAAEHDFDMALRAFIQGGMAIDSTGARVGMAPLTRPEERGILDKAASLWGLLHMRIDALGDVVPDRAAIHALANTALTAALDLSGLMNDLSGEVRRASSQDIAQLSTRRDIFFWLTVFGLFGIVIGFFLHVVEDRRRVRSLAIHLRERNAALEAAAVRQSHVMEAVRQGLCLIDANLTIQGEHSKELGRIFRTDDLEGVNLADIVRRLLPEKLYNAAREHLKSLFDVGKRERVVLDSNPLEEVEVSFPDPSGGLVARCLSFSFRRIVAEQRIAYVFVTVTDVTDRVTLERSRRESERRTQRRFELLMSFLHVDADARAEFLTGIGEQVREMNEILRAIVLTGHGTQHDDVLRQRVETVLACVRRIKNNAAALGIGYFRKKGEEFESKLVELCKHGNFGAEDFLVIAVLQAEFRSDLEESQELNKRMAAVRFTEQTADTPFVRKGSLQATEAHEVPDGIHQALATLEAFTVDLGHQLGKEVRLEMTEFRLQGLETEQRRLLKDVFMHVIRNSVVHGIESPEERVAIGKPALGAICFRTLPAKSGYFSFSCRDDGRGIDVDLVRREAVVRGLFQAESEDIDDSTLARLIFQPGFSTMKAPDAGAMGLGMGLDGIREAIVDRLGGEIALSSQPGEFFELSFTIPMPTRSSARV